MTIQNATAQLVCAVIVTYHPDTPMVDHLSEVVAQVQGLIVVDNGSTAEELEPLRAASRNLNFQLIVANKVTHIINIINQCSG